MKIQVNTDNNVPGDEPLAANVERVVTHALRHVADQVTRVEVHIGDLNSAKGGEDDKRCMMEARLEGFQPVAVTHQAPTLATAIGGAADKLKTALTRAIEKRDASRPPPPDAAPPLPPVD